MACRVAATPAASQQGPLSLFSQKQQHRTLITLVVASVLTCSSQAASLTSSSSVFLQRRPFVIHGTPSGGVHHEEKSCVPIQNHGTHSTVEIAVGTPPQKLSVIADTGSSTLVIRSCVCGYNEGCNLEDRCFKGYGLSSTFDINYAEPQGMRLSYGSGDIDAVVATDIASVGDVSVTMKESLVLMAANNMFFRMNFEGILGLGIPVRTRQEASHDSNGSSSGNASVDAGDGDFSRESRAYADPVDPVAMALLSRRSSYPIAEPLSFLELAGIDRFSFCLNEETGMMKWGTTAEPLLGSVGLYHWGVDFRGISIGDVESPVIFCTPEEMRPGQETPCAGIPDSGTTMITAPRWQLGPLLESICEKWPRCNANWTAYDSTQKKLEEVASKSLNGSAVPWDLFRISKLEIFEMLLDDCDSWLTEDNNLDDELPELHFHIRGSEGTNQALTLRGWAYIMEIFEEQESRSSSDNSRPGEAYFRQESASVHQRSSSDADTSADGVNLEQEADEEQASSAEESTRRPKITCRSAFDVLDYDTTINGPVWIFGTSFFYDYDIGFNLGTNPPSMSFDPLKEQGGCGMCDEGATLLATESESTAAMQQRNIPRKLKGPPRKPDIDITIPL